MEERRLRLLTTRERKVKVLQKAFSASTLKERKNNKDARKDKKAATRKKANMVLTATMPTVNAERELLRATKPAPEKRKYTPVVSKNELVYTNCYCEENVYKLCQRLEAHDASLAEWAVVFISNPSQTVAIWQQKSAPIPNAPVVWDYHVILLHVRPHKKTFVYDFDSRLPFPCSWDLYSHMSFRDQTAIKDSYRSFFRVVYARDYLRTFASDRTHMLNESGEYVKPPPHYSPIKGCDAVDDMNLPRFINMTDRFVGDVVSFETMNERFS